MFKKLFSVSLLATAVFTAFFVYKKTAEPLGDLINPETREKMLQVLSK